MSQLIARHPGKSARWLGTIAQQNAQTAIAYSLDLDTLSIAPAGQTRTYSLATGSFPNGWALSGTRNNILSGTATATGTFVAGMKVSVADGSLPAVKNITFVITAGTALTWNSQQPPGAIQGQAYSADLDNLFDGAGGYEVEDPLPAGLASSGASNRKNLITGIPSASGSTNFRVLARDPTEWALYQDFLARAAVSDTAFNFDTAAQVTADTFQDGQQANVVWDPNIKRGGRGSLRINILPTDSTNAGAWRGWLRPDHAAVGQGGEYWFQLIQWFDTNLFQIYPGGGSGGRANGFKQFILSSREVGNLNGGSHTDNELVMENTFQMGCPLMYHEAGGDGFSALNQPHSSACNTTDFRFQNAIDNGGTVNTCADAWARWGPMYSMPAYTGLIRAGNGGFGYVPNTHMVFMVRVKFGTFGIANSTVQSWMSIHGQAPKLVHNWISNVKFGSENGGHKGYWLTGYNTLKQVGSYLASFTCYPEVLTRIGSVPIPWPVTGTMVTPG